MAWQNDSARTTVLMPNISHEVNFSYLVNLTAEVKMDTDTQLTESPSELMLNFLTVLFCIIGIVGIFGNILVICVILLDRKMRQSVTNIFIMNLAIADFLIMAFGVPEIILFRLNNGWTFGVTWCKINRYILVVALYTSVLSLLSVCVERFVAIVHPIKAQILCNRRKNIMAVVGIWMIAIGCGTPTALYNRTVSSSNITNTYCVSMFPTQNSFVIFKYFEFAFYYFIPVCVQIVLYSIISKRLYVSTDELHTKFQMRTEPNSRKTDRAAETIKARKGVVKMLVASVVVYTLCYAPPQILLFYNTLSKTMFHETWSFQVFVTVIAYINSAANPVLYSIFSQNFRRNFKRCLFCMCLTNSKEPYMRARFTDSFESRGISRKVSTTRTTISRL